MAAVILACALTAGRVSALDQTLLLEVVINGHSTGKIGQFIDHGGALLARSEELADVGLKVADSVPRSADGLVALSSLSGVTARLDTAAQTILIAARPEQLVAAQLRSDPDSSADLDVESGTGA